MKERLLVVRVAVGLVGCVVVGIGGFAIVATAQVMESTTYKIQSDSVNVGGGYGSSTNYQQESTAGELATGESTSASFALRAGYQQMQEVYLSLSAIGDVLMTPALGLSGGVSSGTAAFVVTTDSTAGYQVTFRAANDPALQSPDDVIPNYAPSGGVPDFTFTTDSTEAHFAFSPEGSDIASRFRDNTAACGVGSTDTADACWDFIPTTPLEIVRGATANHPAGATTTLRFRVGIGSFGAVTAGEYTATTTITALPL